MYLNTNSTLQVAPAGELLWLGLYHNETRLGLARGWERCVSADAPSISNWLSEPTDLYGAPMLCRVSCLALRAMPVYIRQRPNMHMHMHSHMCGLCMYYCVFRDSPGPPDLHAPPLLHQGSPSAR